MMMKMGITKESKEITLLIDLKLFLYLEMVVLEMCSNAMIIKVRKKLPLKCFDALKMIKTKLILRLKY